MPPSQPSCGICLENIAGKVYWTITEHEDDKVCDECVDEFIIPLFEMALQEINYPPTWMKELPLHPSDFPEKVEAAFGKDFIARYENAEKEFKTLPQRRLYCRHIVDPEDGKKPKPGDTANENRFKDLREVPLTQRAWRARQRFQACGGFLSAKIPESAYSSVPEPQGRFIALTRLLRGFASGEGAPCSLLALTSTCNSCLGKSYACCGEPILADDSHNETPRQSIERQHREVHVCKSDEQGEHVDLGVRGVDYQLCPRPLCKRPIQLKDGCNHCVCFCGMGFCFICGTGNLRDEDDHWKRRPDGSGCPKFNLKNALNAWFQ